MGHGTQGRRTDDNASELLASILADTKAEAIRQEAALAEDIEARDQRERRRQDEELARRRESGKAKITAETKRLKGLEFLRDERARKLRREIEATPSDFDSSTPTRPGIPSVMPAPPPGSAPVHPQSAVPVAAEDIILETPDEPEMTSASRLVALAAVALVVGGAAVGAFTLTLGGYEEDSSVYMKTVYQPVEHRDAQVAVGFVLVDDHAKTTKRARIAKPRVQRKVVRKAAPVKMEEAKKAPAPPAATAPPALLEDMELGAIDPFSDEP